MNYNDYIEQTGATFQIPVTVGSPSVFTVPNYVTATPRSIEYIENRIQRDLDFINTYASDSGTLTIGVQSFTLPTSTGTFIVPSQISVVIGGVTQAPLLPISVDALFAIYPDTSVANRGVPQFWAPNNGTTIYVAPTPDLAYGLSVRGTQRVTELSSSNTTNALSTLLPDLYIAAGNVFWATFQRDLMLAQGNQGQALLGFEQMYRSLLTPALVEEARKKFQGPGWSSRQPPSIATPPQT